jgi:hypothetical protein
VGEEQRERKGKERGEGRGVWSKGGRGRAAERSREEKRTSTVPQHTNTQTCAF